MTLTELDAQLRACAARMRADEAALTAAVEAYANDAAEMDRLLGERVSASRATP